MEYIELAELVLNLVGGSALISAALPKNVKNYLPILGQLIEVLGANVGNAKNRE